MTTSMLVSSNTTNNLPKRPVQKKQNRLGPYNLLQTLGEGEFGKVKLGIHTETGQEVAIKLIKKEGAGSDTRINKVEREISVLKTLNHPYIVKLYNVVETEKYIGIILEYASGGELFEYILAHRYLKEKDAKRFFAQLISSVQYMHKRKIVHRDLKLENLLLDKNRNIVVTDFGFANQFSSAADDMMATTCGSPCYAAPELVVNAGLYAGSAVDIWSCGVILYAMLCGFLPFDDDPANPDSDNINQLYRYILSTNLMFPSYVSVDARDLLEKILVPDPLKRCSLDYIIKHPWLQAYREYLKKDAVPLDMDSIITSKLSTVSSIHKANNDATTNDKPINFILTSSVSTTVKSTQPKKLIAPNSAASRKTHIPVVSHDRFAPVANDKYILTSNKRNTSNNNRSSNSKTGAFRHFSIGRSSATTTPVEKPSIHATVTPTTTTRTSKVPNFISRKPVKKEEENGAEKMSSDINPEKSLSSPLLDPDSNIPTVSSAMGSIRKNQRRGTDRILNFFTGGRASHIPVVTSKTEERRMSFSLEKKPQANTDEGVVTDVGNSHYHDVNERIQSSIIDDSNDDIDDAMKVGNEEEERSRTLHSSSETSTIGDSTLSLHVLASSPTIDASSPLFPVSSLSIQQQNILNGRDAVTSNTVHVDSSSSITIQNEDFQPEVIDNSNITSSVIVDDIIEEEDEESNEILSRDDETASDISNQQQKMIRNSNISTASILSSDNGGSASMNSSMVSFKDTPRRTPLLFAASQKGGSSSIIMRQQHYNNHRSSIDNASSILSSERQQDNASISSAGTNPQPEVSNSTRLTTAKNGVANVMGDGGRKAMAAVRRSIYRKHKSQPPPSSNSNGQLSDTSSQASSVRATSPTTREPIISFAKSRFEESGNQVVTQKRVQKTDNSHRNTWSAATLISSTSELPNKSRNSTEKPNIVISKNQSTVTSNANIPPKKTGKKMMDWIKKKSHAKETKKETILPNIEKPAVKAEAVTKSSTRLTSSTQLTKSRRTSAKNDTPTSPTTDNSDTANDNNNKIATASNTNKQTNNMVSILATTTTTADRGVSVLPTPAPSPTPQSPQQKKNVDEVHIVIPLETDKSKRAARALSGNEASLAATLKKESGIDERIQFHQGAIDRAALTSQSPTHVIKDIARILRILGIEARPETTNPYILRCCRRKARTLIAAELLKNNKDQEENDNVYDNDRLVINESAITSTSEVSLLAPSTKDAQSLSSRSSIDPSSNDARGLEPIYGDASIDNGDEIRFAVEICRFKNLPGLYIVDMRRLKGSAWAYKFLYHKLIDFLDLRKNGSYIHN